ncbi:MAG: DUF4091 domain-containing protein [Chloroflexi bacterium]|nr:DUF4091 domain-containing protein [Chloroflexota bacterium]
MKKRLFLLALALSLFSLLIVVAIRMRAPGPVARADAGRLVLWAAGDARKILPGAPVESNNVVWDATRGEVRIKAARNETAAFQLVLTATQSLSQVDVTIGAFEGPTALPAGAVTLFREAVYTVGSPSDPWGYGIPAATLPPGPIPDALIPFEDPYQPGQPLGAPFDVLAGENRVIWVDVAIPADSPAGDYAAPITVTVGGKPEAAAVVRLHVWNFTLPDRPSLPILVPSDPYWTLPPQYEMGEDLEGVASVARKMNQALFQHGLLPGSFLSRPQVYEQDGALVLDFTDIDAEMAPYMSAGLSLFHMPDAWDGAAERYPFRDAQGDYYRRAAFDDPVFRQKAIAFYRALRDHYAARGWLDAALAYPTDETQWVADEPLHNGPMGFQRLQQWAQIIKAADEDIRVSAASVFPAAPGPSERGWVDLKGLVDDWQIVADDMEGYPPIFQERQALGETISYYLNDYGDFIDYKAALHRLLVWDAFLYDIDSIQGWAAAAWIDEDLIPQNPWETSLDGVFGHGGGAFFWPGNHIEGDPDLNTNGPLPSLRLKLLRQALYDYEYLRLLAETTSSGYAKGVARDLIPRDLFHADPPLERFYAQREWMGEILGGEREMTPVTISGRVTDANAATGVAGALVQAAHTAARTDASGVYTLTLAANETTITVTHPRYHPQVVSVASSPLNINLTPLAQETTLLFSFEDEAEVEAWEPTNVISLARVQAHATDGQWALAVQFDDKPAEDAEIGAWDLPLLDWRGYDFLELDAYHASDYYTEFEVGVADDAGGWYPSTGGAIFFWPRMARRIVIPISELGRDLDLSAIGWLSLAPETVTEQTDYKNNVRRWPLGPRLFYIDNIRLIRLLETPLPQPTLAPTTTPTPTPHSTPVRQWLPLLRG